MIKCEVIDQFDIEKCIKTRHDRAPSIWDQTNGSKGDLNLGASCTRGLNSFDVDMINSSTISTTTAGHLVETEGAAQDKAIAKTAASHL